MCWCLIVCCQKLAQYHILHIVLHIVLVVYHTAKVLLWLIKYKYAGVCVATKRVNNVPAIFVGCQEETAASSCAVSDGK